MKKHLLGKVTMVLSAVFLIGAGGAAFAAVNENMLANELDKTVSVAAAGTLPPAVGVPAAVTAQTDYTVTDSSEGSLPQSAMTAREAAGTASEYLQRVFGHGSKGFVYDMVSEMNPLNISLKAIPNVTREDLYWQVERAAWNGYVTNESGQMTFIFSMDAITGEMLSVHFQGISSPEKPVKALFYDNPASLTFWNNNREEYLALAKGFVEKHLQTSAVSAEFEAISALGIEMEDDGSLSAWHNLLEINVTDEYGKEVIAVVTAGTKELYEIYYADSVRPEDRALNAERREEMGYK